MISAVVLAAGKGERMGKAKLFLPWREKVMLQWVLESVLASAVDEVICVVRDLAAVRAHVAVKDERLLWLVNDRADAGQSASVTAGLWAMDGRSDRALFTVGDQPMLESALLDALIDRSKRVAAPIIAPNFKGQIRNPVLFRRELFPELLKLKGDHGGRSLIEKLRDRVELVEWTSAATFMDIDDEKDYERLKLMA
jgi:molybdenum cofactor cytidylyltransferase